MQYKGTCHHDQQVTCVYLRARPDHDGIDLPRMLGVQLRLHFHRFNREQCLAFFD